MNKVVWSLILCLLPVSAAEAQPVFQPGPPVRIMGCVVNVATLPRTAKCIDTVNKRNINKARRQVEQALASEKKKFEKQLKLTQALPAFKDSARALKTLETCLARKRVRLNKQMSDAARNPLEFVDGKLRRLSTVAIRQAINSKDLLTAYRNRRRMQPAALLDAFFDDIDRRMAGLVRGDPLAECGWAATTPWKKRVRDAAILHHRHLQTTINRQLKPVLDQVMVDVLKPSLQQAAISARAFTTQLARDQIGRVAGFDELLDGMARQHLLSSEKTKQLKTETDGLLRAVRSNNQTAVLAHQRKIEALIADLDRFDDRLALQIGLGALRLKGHEIVDDLVGELMNLLGGPVAVGKDMAVSSVSAGADFAYQPVAAIMEALQIFIGAVYEIAWLGLQEGARLGARAGFDALMDHIEEQMMQGRLPSQSRSGPLAALVPFFPKERQIVKFASPQVESMHADLANYHRAILNLSRAATAGGS